MFIIDSSNKISNPNIIPDPLRGELGTYYYEDADGNVNSVSFATGKIAATKFDHSVEQDDSRLSPLKKTTISFRGSEDAFRNQNQWRDFIQATIPVQNDFYDHKTNFEVPQISERFMTKNDSHISYEDSTKIYPTKQTLNYNLNKYSYLDSATDLIKNIAMMRTRFDLVDPSVETILNQFSNRITNFSGSATEISDKQTNIFILHEDSGDRLGSDDFPYYLGYNFNQEVDSNLDFTTMLKDNNKFKNMFKNINSPTNFNFADFFVDNSLRTIKIYDIFSMMTKKSISEFSEGPNEIFLLEQQDMIDLQENNFFEGIDALYFIAAMRDMLKSNLRNIEDIFNGSDHDSFLMGYKIEKYIDNDLGGPIQTYYTINNKFTDTQLKYGRKYVYKVKALVGVMGSSYRYVNLSTSENPNTEGQSAENPYFLEKFWCTVDVESRPSFKLLEIDMEQKDESFVDAPTQSPIVEVFSRKNEPRINFLLRPRAFGTEYEEVLSDGELVLNVAVNNLKEADKLVTPYLNLSNNSYSTADRFTGKYEIYMIDYMPASVQDFSNKLIATVDEKVDHVYPENYQGDRISVDNLNAIFSQKIPVNKKYYYLFRAVTYHGTPSPASSIYEVELLKDSDEYKTSFREVNLDFRELVTTSSPMKRIMSIEPNYERLILNEDTGTLTDNETDSGNLTTMIDGANQKVFKVRLTSKHTGKKIDINLRFKIVKDGTFNP